MSAIANALTIAGSDSGGGAGIQADIKAMSANGVYAASVLTALTAQNTLGVTAIHDVPAKFIAAQIDAVFGDIELAAVKIGMLSRVETIRAVSDGLRRHGARNVVVDPVMVAASGDPLLRDDAVEALQSDLFPLVTLITPNLHEAARLTGLPVAEDRDAMRAQAMAIAGQSRLAVLVKGGHGHGDKSEDLLWQDGREQWFSAPRIVTKNTHGTGCSLSSAIAAHLARGADLTEAIKRAKHWLTGAIAAADELHVGKGHGPVHHFHEFWSHESPKAWQGEKK